MKSLPADRDAMEPLLSSEPNDLEIGNGASSLKRHDLKAARAESFGRARLFVFSLVAFFLIYLSITYGSYELPQMVVVRVPPDDNSSGYSGLYSLLNPPFSWLPPFAVVLARNWHLICVSCFSFRNWHNPPHSRESIAE